ncbi:unnamed protein product [Amoebophrya sp. A120]|nr:unnamed protein product [Amoebophrya sp. A120]|eukprot:GSA120T00016530001.1
MYFAESAKSRRKGNHSSAIMVSSITMCSFSSQNSFASFSSRSSRTPTSFVQTMWSKKLCTSFRNDTKSSSEQKSRSGGEDEDDVVVVREDEAPAAPPATVGSCMILDVVDEVLLFFVSFSFLEVILFEDAVLSPPEVEHELAQELLDEFLLVSRCTLATRASRSSISPSIRVQHLGHLPQETPGCPGRKTCVRTCRTWQTRADTSW